MTQRPTVVGVILCKGMAEALHKAGSEVLRDTYAQKTALRLGVSASKRCARNSKKASRAKTSPQKSPTSRTSDLSNRSASAAPTQHEWWLLRVLLESDDHVEWVAAHLDVAWLPTADAREIVSQRLRWG
jgi:DNA primase